MANASPTTFTSTADDGRRRLVAILVALVLLCAIDVTLRYAAPRLPELKDTGRVGGIAAVHQAVLNPSRARGGCANLVVIVGSSTGLYGIDESVVEDGLSAQDARVLNLCVGASYGVTNVAVLRSVLSLQPTLVVWAIHPEMFMRPREPDPLALSEYWRPYESAASTLGVSQLYQSFSDLEGRHRAVVSDLTVGCSSLFRLRALMFDQAIGIGRSARGSQSPWGRHRSPSLTTVWRAGQPLLPFKGFEPEADWRPRATAAIAAAAALSRREGCEVLVIRVPTGASRQATGATADADRCIRELCVVNGLGYAAIPCTVKPDWVSRDGFHLNASGKAAVSRMALPPIAQALSD